jgi:RimJ/RimL family protein N-acetyltransferase
MYPVVLESPRLRARELTVEDAEAIWATEQERAGTFYAPGAAQDLDGVRRWVDEVAAAAAGPDRWRYRLGLELIEDGELIGGVTVAADDRTNRKGEIGYGLRIRHWGMGYGTEAVSLALRLAFGDLGLHRIEALIEPGNSRSINIVTKLGFSQEGRMRERHLEPHGWEDALVFGLLEDEWRAR